MKSDDGFAKQVEEAISAGKTNPPTSLSPDASEDSTAWLELDPEGLEELLRQRGGEKLRDESQREDAMAEAFADPLTSFAQKVEGFVEGEGSLEGAMFDECAVSAGASCRSLLFATVNYRMTTNRMRRKTSR